MSVNHCAYDACGKKFGLIRHRCGVGPTHRQFCRLRCKEAFIRQKQERHKMLPALRRLLSHGGVLQTPT